MLPVLAPRATGAVDDDPPNEVVNGDGVLLDEGSIYIMVPRHQRIAGIAEHVNVSRSLGHHFPRQMRHERARLGDLWHVQVDARHGRHIKKWYNNVDFVKVDRTARAQGVDDLLHPGGAGLVERGCENICCPCLERALRARVNLRLSLLVGSDKFVYRTRALAFGYSVIVRHDSVLVGWMRLQN